MIARINESKTSERHISCKCKCKIGLENVIQNKSRKHVCEKDLFLCE